MELEQKEKLISLKEASKGSPYSPDYLGLLIRNGKIKGSKQDGKWMTTKQDLDDYLEKVAAASYQHQETLNVKVPAAESKKALVNLKWGIFLVIIFVAALVLWRADGRGSDAAEFRVEKDAQNNLIIYADDPGAIGTVTVLPKDPQE